MMKKSISIVSISILLFSIVTFAGTEQQDMAELKAALTKILPDMDPVINSTPLQGLYEVSVGSNVVYFNKDASLMFEGRLLDIKSGVDLTQASKEEANRRAGPQRLAKLDKIPESEMVIYGDKKSPHTLTVFTDVDCGYCRKLHREMDELNDLGIRVRYLAYPRAGIGSSGYKKLVSVWCAKDRQKAMTDAKSGIKIKSEECDNPVKKQFAMGQEFGVSGTPALILENGTLLPGYAPAKRLLKILQDNKRPVAETVNN